MKPHELPDIDPLKRVWPEPKAPSVWRVVSEGFKTLLVVLFILGLIVLQQNLDLQHQLEDEKLARLKANERTAALMNGRPLVDQHEGVAYIPEGKVTAVKVR